MPGFQFRLAQRSILLELLFKPAFERRTGPKPLSETSPTHTQGNWMQSKFCRNFVVRKAVQTHEQHGAFRLIEPLADFLDQLGII